MTACAPFTRNMPLLSPLSWRDHSGAMGIRVGTRLDMSTNFRNDGMLIGHGRLASKRLGCNHLGLHTDTGTLRAVEFINFAYRITTNDKLSRPVTAKSFHPKPVTPYE